MPAPEPRKAPQGPQEASAPAEGPNAPTDTPAFRVNPQGPRKQEAPVPVKDEDGNPVIKAVSATDTTIPHEGDETAPDGPRLDETVPGGRYQVGDKIVNCNGEVLGDAPVPKKK